MQLLNLNSEIVFKVRHYYEETCFFGTFFTQSEKCSENQIEIEKTKKWVLELDPSILLKKTDRKNLFPTNS